MINNIDKKYNKCPACNIFRVGTLFFVVFVLLSLYYLYICSSIGCLLKCREGSGTIKECILNFVITMKKMCGNVWEMLNVALSESAVSRTWVFEWYKRFQESRQDVEDDYRSGRLSTSTIKNNVERVRRSMINNDRRIPFGTCKAFLSEV